MKTDLGSGDNIVFGKLLRENRNLKQTMRLIGEHIKKDL